MIEKKAVRLRDTQAACRACISCLKFEFSFAAWRAISSQAHLLVAAPSVAFGFIAEVRTMIPFQGQGWRLGTGELVDSVAASTGGTVVPAVRRSDSNDSSVPANQEALRQAECLNPVLTPEQRQSIREDLTKILTSVQAYLVKLIPQDAKHRPCLQDLEFEITCLLVSLQDESFDDMQRNLPPSEWLCTNDVLLRCTCLGSEFQRVRLSLSTQLLTEAKEVVKESVVVDVEQEASDSSPEFAVATQDYSTPSPTATPERPRWRSETWNWAATPEVRPSGSLSTPSPLRTTRASSPIRSPSPMQPRASSPILSPPPKHKRRRLSKKSKASDGWAGKDLD